MESHFHYSLWAVQTYSYVLWPMQLSAYLPGVHEPYLHQLPHQRMAHHLYGQPPGALSQLGGTYLVCSVGSSVFV